VSSCAWIFAAAKEQISHVNASAAVDHEEIAAVSLAICFIGRIVMEREMVFLIAIPEISNRVGYCQRQIVNVDNLKQNRLPVAPGAVRFSDTCVRQFRTASSI
jgi:hypothetical protein